MHMHERHFPPGCRSPSENGMVKPFGAHHWLRCSFLVQASNTRCRGAGKIRVISSTRPAGSRLGLLFFSGMFFFLFLQLFLVVVETVETLFPVAAILLQPVDRFLHRCSFKPAWSPLGVTCALDQAAALQYTQVFRNRRQTHVVWLGEFRHGGLARGKSGENR